MSMMCGVTLTYPRRRHAVNLTKTPCVSAEGSGLFGTTTNNREDSSTLLQGEGGATVESHGSEERERANTSRLSGSDLSTATTLSSKLGQRFVLERRVSFPIITYIDTRTLSSVSTS